MRVGDDDTIKLLDAVVVLKVQQRAELEVGLLVRAHAEVDDEVFVRWCVDVGRAAVLDVPEQAGQLTIGHGLESIRRCGFP